MVPNYGRYSEPRVISSPGLMSSGHLAMSRNIFGVTAGEVQLASYWVEVRDAAKQLSTQRTALHLPPTENHWVQNVNSAEVENPRTRVGPTEPKGRNTLSKTVIVRK